MLVWIFKILGDLKYGFEDCLKLLDISEFSICIIFMKLFCTQLSSIFKTSQFRKEKCLNFKFQKIIWKS